jgi:23S rRNA-/tRNA-specific pseudouridylate synthase
MPPDARERLDHYLVRLGWARSRRAAREMLACGMVRVNGRVLRKGEMVAGGDAVEIAAISTLPVLVSDPEVKIEVLFRDSAMLVVNKPAPMACHPLRPGERGTLMNSVVAAFPEAGTAGDNPREGGLVHRLDNGTSGALLVALTPAAFITLREEIRAGRIRRDYQALVVGNLKESLEIQHLLAHDPRNARRMRAVAANVAGARLRSNRYAAMDISPWSRRDRAPGCAIRFGCIWLRQAIRLPATCSMAGRRSTRSPTAASGFILRRSNFAHPPRVPCECARHSREISKMRSRRRAVAFSGGPTIYLST